MGKPRFQFDWADAISKSEWEIYRAAMQALRDADVPFMLGGGFALATFTGRWRDTKDIDFYIHPRDRESVIAALTKAGLKDYYSRLAYDRKWIYRSTKANVIVDIILAMANQRAQVDDEWFKRANEVTIRSEKIKVIPPEEFLWCKLYIMQRDHCDWPDIFNLLYANPDLDWTHLIKRLEKDTPMLQALLLVYSWLCPKAARNLPASLWRRLKLKPQTTPLPRGSNHVRLLDSRGWFSALLPSGQKLEV